MSSLPGPALQNGIDPSTLRRVVVEPVSQIAFWSAIVLPFLYLPLLATGLESQSTALVFLILVTANVCALLLGHSHRRD